MDEKYELLIERIHLLEQRIKELENDNKKGIKEISILPNKNYSFINRIKIGTVQVYKENRYLFMLLLAGIFIGYLALFQYTKLSLPVFNYGIFILVYHIVLAAFFSWAVTLLILLNLHLIKRGKSINKKEKTTVTVAGVSSVVSSFGASVSASAAAPAVGVACSTVVCSTTLAPELAALGGSAGSIAASSLGGSNILGSSISTLIIGVAIVISILSLMSISKKL